MKTNTTSSRPNFTLKNSALFVWIVFTVAAIFNANAQTLSQKWENVDVTTGHRGIAYNPITKNILVAQTSGSILRFFSTNGLSAGANLDATGISGGTFALSGVTVTKDGVIFGCNYVTGAQSTSPLKVYRWDNEDAIPTEVASLGTLPGATTDRFGQYVKVFTTATTTNLLISGTTTFGYLLIYDGAAWTFKQLTTDSQTMTPGGTFVDYNAPGFANRFRVIAKSRGSGGQLYNFDPTSPSPINLTLAKTPMTGPMAFIANGATSHDYDPKTGLIGLTTSTLQVAGAVNPYTNMICSTTGGVNAPVELSRVTIENVTNDGGTAGGTVWGTDGRLYTFIPVGGAGLRAFDVSAFLITGPSSATKVSGQSVTFSSVFGGSELTYVWDKDGTPLSNDSKYSGATTASLTVNNLVGADAGTYTVTATDANSGTAIASAVLTISPSKAWTGGGTDDNWSTADNWGGIALATSGETAVFSGATRLMPVMDGSYDVTGLLFNSTAGAFTLTNSAAQALTLSGTLANESANLQTIALPVILNSDQTVDINAPVTISGSLSGSAILTKTGAGTLTLSGANTHNGTINISGGTLSVANGAAISDAGTVTMATGGILNVDSAETIGALAGSASSVVLNGKLIIGGAGGTYTGGISGTNDLEISVSGTQAVNSATIYSGSTVLTAGTLSINDSSTFGDGTGTLQFNGGALFRASQSVAQTFANPVSLTADSILAGNPASGTREVRFSGATLTNTAGTLTVTNMAASGTGVLLVRLSGTSTVCSMPIALNQGSFGRVELLLANAATGVQVISGTISGNGKVVKNSTSTARQTTISGNNSFSGGFDLLAGRVNLNHNNAVGTGLITISNATTIQLASTAGSPVVITNDIFLRAGANPVVYANGTGSTLELAGIISGEDGASRITRNNTGNTMLILSGDNTFAGGVSIISRNMTLKHRNALGSGTFDIGDPLLVTGPATTISLTAGVDLTGPNAVANSVNVNTNFTVSGVNGLEFSGAVTLAPVPKIVTLSGTTSFAKWSGSVSGSEGFTKAGSGTLELSGFNGYAGDTTVSAGTLRVNSSLTTSPIIVSAAGTLSGSGPVEQVTLDGIVSPGNNVGAITTANQTWNGGGRYAWELNDATGSAGSDPGWDTVTVNGALTINANSGSPFTIDVKSLAGAIAGAAANFNNTVTQSWTIVTTTGGITGFDPAAFNFVTTGFSNLLGSASFEIAMSLDGNNLELFLIPSPQAYNFVMTGAGSATFAGHANTAYTIQYTDSLNPIDWKVLTAVGSSGVVTTDGAGLGSFADPGPQQAERYYRVSVP